MKNLRTLALTAVSSGLIAIGSSMAIAQTVNNYDNTSPGESGHGMGCSNAQTSAGGGGAAGDTNCMGNASKTINGDGTYNTTPGTVDPSTSNSNVITTNPDNSTSGETGHGLGCSNGQTAGSGNGTMNGGTGTNCQNTSN
ncbi:MAG TPA: hypothetical protein VHA35_05880 [Dongiaceae bacterium]|nr:hypothetical protein [Dongiaceae bacterium]